MKSISLNTILLIGVAVLLTLQIHGCFDNAKIDKQYKKDIAGKDKEIEQVKIERDSIRSKYDIAVQELMKKDTVLVTRLVSNDKKQQNIITIVRDASKDELRRFVSEY